MPKEPLYPHVPKSRKPDNIGVRPAPAALAAADAFTLANWLIMRRETARGNEIKEYEKLAVQLEWAGLPSLANKAREIGGKELEVVNELENIAKELRRTFPGDLTPP